jgi:murein hydrolase activator
MIRVLRASAVALLLLAGAPTFAQEISAKLKQLRADSEAREATARQLSQQADSLLARLEALDVEIVEVQRSQRRFTQRERDAMAELEAARQGMTDADARIQELGVQLGARLVALYKFSVTGGMPALYSERDFQSSLRLRDGLGQVLSTDAKLFAQYRQARQDWQARSEQAETAVQDITVTRQESGSRRELERQKRIEKRNMVELLRVRARRQEQLAEELREAAGRLEKQVAGVSPQGAAPKGAGLQKGALLSPVVGSIKTRFGIQVDPQFNTRIRSGGVEFEAPRGADVRAVAPGRVVYADWYKGYGQVVIIDHGDDSVTVSGYLDEVAVAVDTRVQRGQVIGKVGDTGSVSEPALYFELRRKGKPVDPRPWFESGTEGKS